MSDGEHNDDTRTEGDVGLLRQSLLAAERRAATLAELTISMSEGSDPLTLAQRAVQLTARATRAAGAFVYLWDADEQRLVLREATDGWQRSQLGRIKLRVGEGVTGWSALMRQTVLLNEDPSRDPRFKTFAELRETAFRSMVAVPIVAPGHEVLGVFSLYAGHEGAFSAADVGLATEVGSLLANGLVQAEMLTALKVQSRAARFLTDLPPDAWGSVAQCLDTMASECAAHLDADVCVIEVTPDRAHGQSTCSVFVSPSFRDEHRRHLGDRRLEKSTLAQLLPDWNLQRVRIPLGAAVPIGALTCYRVRRFSDSDERLLEAIGGQIASGVLSLGGADRVSPVAEQFLSSPDPVATEALLRRHGWRPGTCLVTMLRVQSTATEAHIDERRVRELFKKAFHAQDDEVSLFAVGDRYLTIVRSSEVENSGALVSRLKELGNEPGLRVTAGVGPIAQNAAQVHVAVRHAAAAAQWAELVNRNEPTIVCYEQIAHMRLMPKVALAMSDDLRDLMQAMAPVVAYDLENGTELTLTLEAFLTNSGSVAKTSTQLFIHRNTLRQRIQRIEEMVGQPADEFADWTATGMASRLITQSAAELKRPAAAKTGAPCPRGVTSIGRSCCGLPERCLLQPAAHPVKNRTPEAS